MIGSIFRIQNISFNDSIASNVYEDVAKVASRSGDFDKSMKWRQKATQLNRKVK